MLENLLPKLMWPYFMNNQVLRTIRFFFLSSKLSIFFIASWFSKIISLLDIIVISSFPLFLSPSKPSHIPLFVLFSNLCCNAPKLTCKPHLAQNQVTSWNVGNSNTWETPKPHRKVWWPRRLSLQAPATHGSLLPFQLGKSGEWSWPKDISRSAFNIFNTWLL